jgi:hypothetical protein
LIVKPPHYKNGTNDITMLGRSLAKIAATQENVVSHHGKTDATVREMKAGQEIMKEEMLAKLDDHLERMMSRMDSQLEKMEACLGKTEAKDLEVNPDGKRP